MSAKGFSLLPHGLQKQLSLQAKRLPIIQANFELPTLLAIGMCLQTLAFLLFPRYLAASPAALLLIYRLLHAFPRTTEANWNLKHSRIGKWSAGVPNQDGKMPKEKGGQQVVCFVVGNQINHPLGILAPGVKKTGEYFQAMWKDAEENREKWGYLSHTPPFVSQSPNRGNYLLVISYWKSLDHLRDFAAHSIHAEGRKYWERTRKEWPHIGIFHETYVAPPGCWETVYENMWPFGMGAIRLRDGEKGGGNGEEGGDDNLGEKGEGGKVKWGEIGGTLERADGHVGRSMDSRMGREV